MPDLDDGNVIEPGDDAWRDLNFHSRGERCRPVVQRSVFVPIIRVLGIPLAGLDPRSFAISEVLLFVAVFTATFVMARSEKRAWLSYGYSKTPDARARYFSGALYGVAMAAAIGILMYVFDGFRINGFALRGSGWLIYPLLWLVVMLLVGFNEELAFRGYPLQTLGRGIGFWPAAIVMSLLFGAAHLTKSDENAVDIAAIVFFGLFVSFTLWRTGTLWFAAGFHFAFDFMQFFVIGTRNGGALPQGHLFNATFPGPAWVNGGPLGTEASYFIFPALAATWLLFALSNRQTSLSSFDKFRMTTDATPRRS